MGILPRRPVRASFDWIDFPRPLPVLPFTAAVAPRPAAAQPSRPRAPKGGVVFAGRSYKGGQILPATPAPVAPAADIPNVWDPGDSWETWRDDDRPIESPATPAPAPVPKMLAIHGFTYTAREIPAGVCGSVAFELHKVDTNHHYHVIRDEFGVLKCDCPDYLLRCEGTGRVCKHGRRLVELGMVAAPSPVRSTLGVREFAGGCSVIRNATPIRADYPPRDAGPRGFEPTPEDQAEAALLFAECR